LFETEGGNDMTCIICIIGMFEMRGTNLPPRKLLILPYRHESVKLSTTSAVVHAVIKIVLPYLEELFTLNTNALRAN
jgi:hypothetical protein